MLNKIAEEFVRRTEVVCIRICLRTLLLIFRNRWGVQIVRTARRGVSRKIRTLTSRRAPLSERLEQARSSALIH